MCTVGILSGMRMRMWMTVLRRFTGYRKGIIAGYVGRRGFFQANFCHKVSQISLRKISNPSMESWSLHWTRNSTSVSNVCGWAPVSLFCAPTDSTKRVSNFLLSRLANRQCFFNFKRPIMACTQIWVHRWGGRTGISALFETVGTQPELSCVWWSRLGG